MIVSWPAGIKARGENRTQYAHAIDMVPTVLDILGVEPPTAIRGVAQAPIEGVSFAHSFDNADATSNHHTQYFEMFGCRAVDHEGWRAVCGFPGPSYAEGAEKGRNFGDEITPEILDDLDANGWELYHVAEDPAECNNLAAEHPEKLAAMVARWYVEAGKYQVLPLDGSCDAALCNGTAAFDDVAKSICFLSKLVGRSNWQHTSRFQSSSQHYGGS